MSKCKDCKYAHDSSYEIAGIECCTCSLTRRVMNANAERWLGLQMIRSIKIGDTVKCLNCGEAIVIGSETVCFTFDAEYIRCPKCNKVIDMQLYHMYGTKIRKDGGDSK